MRIPDLQDSRLALGAVRGAFAPSGGFDELQAAVFGAIARDVYDLDVDAEPIAALTSHDVLGREPDAWLRRHAVCVMAVLELVAHPLSRQAADDVRRYAHQLGVDLSVLGAARALAHRHAGLMYADLQRSSWYTKQTIRGSLHGHFLDLAESKLAYSGFIEDRPLSRKWLALRDCPPGSWGRGVADFYERHDFPFPGTAHGIYEIGAKHDFVHVLADFPVSAEGEIDVFSFIAGSMSNEDGIVLLAVTLGLFQNGSIHRVAGKRVKIARCDTLSDPGAVDRFSDALRRGSRTTVDVMGSIDHFTYADVPLEQVRSRLGVIPERAVPAPAS